MTANSIGDVSGYHVINERDRKAEALRQRQLQDRQTYSRLQNRTDYVVDPGSVGTRAQSLQRVPLGDVQRLPAGEQIVRNPALLRNAIMPAPTAAPYTPKIQKPPMKVVPSTLYTGGIMPGIPVKKWPTSFKKAFHKPTADESIMRGLNNLDSMSRSLLGRPKGR